MLFSNCALLNVICSKLSNQMQRLTFKTFLASATDWLLPGSEGPATFFPVSPPNDHSMAQRVGYEVYESLPFPWKGYY